jgi:hypothetical protein
MLALHNFFYLPCTLCARNLLYDLGMLKIQYFHDLDRTAIYSAKICHFSDNTTTISVVP